MAVRQLRGELVVGLRVEYCAPVRHFGAAGVEVGMPMTTVIERATPPGSLNLQVLASWIYLAPRKQRQYP
jgi:hypothetical protein